MDVPSSSGSRPISPMIPPRDSVDVTAESSSSSSSDISLSTKKRPSSSIVRAAIQAFSLLGKKRLVSKMPDHVPYDIMHDVFDCLPPENVGPLELVSGKMDTQARKYLSSTKKNSNPVQMINSYLSQGNRKAAFQYFKDHMNAPPEKTQEKLELIVSVAAQPHMINQFKYRTWFQALKNFFIPDEKTKLFRQCGKLILDNLENEHLMFLEINMIKNKESLFKNMRMFLPSDNERILFENHFHRVEDLIYLGKRAPRISQDVVFYLTKRHLTERHREDHHALYHSIKKTYHTFAPDGGITAKAFTFFVEKLIRENCEKQLYDQAARWIYVVTEDPFRDKFFEEEILSVIAQDHREPLHKAYLKLIDQSNKQPLQK